MKTKTCESPECKAEMVFLKNPKSGKMVPVDVDSLSEEDVQELEAEREIQWDNARHVSHYKTCKDPQRFTSR